MASEDLLKKAVAAFNSLSSEQQAEMLEEQRQSWVRGNVGLSRDERGMNTPVAPVSPDATGKCGELVTVLTQSRARRYMEGEGGPWGYWKDGPALTPPPYFQVEERELCDRSQAEELLAAEIELKQHWKDEAERFRIEFEKVAYDCRLSQVRVEALEAKLAAAEKALEAIEDHAARCFSLSTHSTIALAYLQDIQNEARAVLGGKP